MLNVTAPPITARSAWVSPVYVADSLRLAFPSTVMAYDRYVLTIAGYFDESGTHSGSDTVAVAGYLAVPAAWEHFEQEWRVALADFGLDAFHMTDFANRAQVYEGWEEHEYRDRFARLVDIINRHVLCSIGAAIPMSAYREAFSTEATGAHAAPYVLATSMCITLAARVVRAQSFDARIAYVFESGARGQGDVLEMFTANQRDEANREHHRLLRVAFEGKREFVPLQAADILAYELSRHLPRLLGSDPRPARRHHLDQLGVVDPHWEYLDAAGLEGLAAVLPGSPLRLPSSRAIPRRPRRGDRGRGA